MAELIPVVVNRAVRNEVIDVEGVSVLIEVPDMVREIRGVIVGKFPVAETVNVFIWEIFDDTLATGVADNVLI